MTTILVVVAVASLLSTATAIFFVVRYVKRLLLDFKKMEQARKLETVVFLKTSIEHMEALHAGTAKQIAVLKEHAEKLEREAQ